MARRAENLLPDPVIKTLRLKFKSFVKKGAVDYERSETIFMRHLHSRVCFHIRLYCGPW